jgi:hypothetical protein
MPKVSTTLTWWSVRPKTNEAFVRRGFDAMIRVVYELVS